MINNSGGFQRIIELLNADLTHIAVGTGTTLTADSTQLVTEVFRNAVSETTIDGNVLIKELFLSESQANVTIREIGLLGTGATGSVGSGELFASELASIPKDNTQSLTISFEIEALEVT